MSDIARLIDNYIAIWNEPDPERRHRLIAETWSEDASYVDPLMSGEGREGIDAMVATAQGQFPGHRFELAEGPDTHNDRVRFTWRLVPEAGGDAVAVGYDFGALAPDGRLQEVTGFLAAATSARTT
ncbi:MAG TPA: nuclear transport factor 2 family protein [Gaiellales bacterium]|jgi:hypothetical protein|nr:nuclear transport factor 2 family protein [Gaiellales bacterium]